MIAMSIIGAVSEGATAGLVRKVPDWFSRTWAWTGLVRKASRCGVQVDTEKSVPNSKTLYRDPRSSALTERSPYAILGAYG